MAVRMIEIYADESGKLADGHFLCICACIANSEAWMELAKKWVGLLRRDSRSYIHMRELTYLGADELDRQLADYRDVMREKSPSGYQRRLRPRLLPENGQMEGRTAGRA